jgi:hypothetical protein
MSSQYKILLLVVALASGLLAQQMAAPATQATGARVMGKRDKGKEDQVAKLFETIRTDAKIPHLGRIGHRDSLEQEVCTAALTGTIPKYASSNTYALYKTMEPDSVSVELHRVASFNQLHPKANPSIARYSVAVWHWTDAQTGESTYWVGIHLYWSAAMEFVDYHFTDDIYSHNDWKKQVAPQCRNKHSGRPHTDLDSSAFCSSSRASRTPLIYLRRPI